MVAMVYCRGFRFIVSVSLVATSLMMSGFSQETPPVSAARDSADKPDPSKSASGTFAEPMVARVELRLTIGDKEVDVIEKGDLLTVLEEREKSFLIRTFRGVKGGIEKANLITLAESVETYDEVIKENPKVGRFYTLRAGAHWARGNTEKALADFNEAIKLGYDSANAFSSRALFLTATHAYEKAVEDFSKAIEKGDKSEAIYVNRAAAYLQMNMVRRCDSRLLSSSSAKRQKCRRDPTTRNCTQS